MNALELQNEQRAAVKLDSGGRASAAQRRMGRTFCFREMLSIVHSRTSVLLIGHLKPMSKAVSKGSFRGPCSREAAAQPAYAVLSLLCPRGPSCSRACRLRRTLRS